MSLSTHTRCGQQHRVDERCPHAVVEIGSTSIPCSDPPCNTTLMVAFTPMHPLTWYDLACNAHRERAIATANPYMVARMMERGSRPDWAVPK